MSAEKVNENQGAQVIFMPKKESYTQVPNDIMDKLYSKGFHLPGEQGAVFNFILRKTIGWGKNSDKLSLSQFASALGIKKQSADRAIRALTSRKIINVSKDADSQVKVYGINTNTDEWQPSAKMLPSATTLKTVSKDADKPSAKTLNTKDNKETITKEIKNSSCSGFENPNEEAEKIIPETPAKKSKKYSFDESHAKLSGLLASEILKNKPDFKLPAKLDEWSDSARLMIERDKRSPSDIEAVILWCQKDSFWKGNILSMGKLREKFDKLQIRMRERPKSNNGLITLHDRNRAACEEAIRRYGNEED